MDGIALQTTATFIEHEIVCGHGTEVCQLGALKEFGDLISPVSWNELTFDLPNDFETVLKNARFSYLNRCGNVEAQTFVFST